MKVLHIITDLSTGGAEMMLLKLLERVSPGVESHVLSLTDSAEIGERISALGVPIDSLGMRPGVPDPWGFIRLYRRVRRLRPDVVQTWMYHADLVGGLATRLAGVKALAWNIRNSDLSPDKTKRSTRAVVSLCAMLSRLLPAGIVCCSVAARNIHHEALGYDANKFEVIPNGFDLSRFKVDPVARLAVRNELRLDDAVPLVGLIARYGPQKNHSGFIEAAAKLHDVRPDVHFLCAGVGVDTRNRELTEKLEKAGIASVTHLLGLRNDVPRLMAALDVCVSSSSYGEAFPNVLGEAMSCGVPCAVTDVGDSAAIVGDTGRVVAPEDMAALAEAIKALLELSDKERWRVAERCRTRVAEHFEINQIVRLYEGFYDKVIRKVRNHERLRQ